MSHTHTRGTSVPVVSRSPAWTCEVLFYTLPEGDAVWPPSSSSSSSSSSPFTLARPCWVGGDESLGTGRKPATE